MNSFPTIRIIPQYIPERFFLNEQGELRSTPRRKQEVYPDFPFLYLSNGEPWDLGNSYLVKYAEDRAGTTSYNSETIYSIARCLVDYATFLEKEGLDPLDMPVDKFERPTYLYRDELIQRCKRGELRSSTAQKRMSSIVNFYRGLSSWDLIDDVMFKRTHTARKAFIQVTNSEGFTKALSLTITDLAVPIVPKTLKPGHVQDGGVLTPLLPDEQQILWKEIAKLERGQQLMFRVATETGARLQTVCTLRWSSLLDAVLIKNTYFIAIGRNSVVDSKFEKSHELQMSANLREALLIYVESSSARERREKSFYGDCKNNYLFLTSHGAPYLTSRQEKIDRRKHNEYPIKIEDQHQSIESENPPAKTKRGNTLQVIVLKIKKAIWLTYRDFPNFSFHDLRATFAVNLLNLELDFMAQENARLKAGGLQETITITDCLQKVCRAMGHSNLATTQQYLQFRTPLSETFKDQLLREYSLSMVSPKGGAN